LEGLKHGIISEINDYYSKGNKVVVSKDFKLAKILSETTSDIKPVQSNEIINKINTFSEFESCGKIEDLNIFAG